MYVVKTKALISCAVTAQPICTFFAYAKGRFSQDTAHILLRFNSPVNTKGMSNHQLPNNTVPQKASQR